MITRIFLALVALAFFAFGGWSLVDPIGMTSGMDVVVSGANGAFEMAGIYGGVSLGAALLNLAGAVSPRMTRPALWFNVAYMGGYWIARPAAWLLHGGPTSQFYPFMAFEAAVLIGALISLRAISK
ncbi:MAG: DUF4345 family protein [Pseudomonadota bacterium]